MEREREVRKEGKRSKLVRGMWNEEGKGVFRRRMEGIK